MRISEVIVNRPRTGHYYVIRAKELRQVQATFGQVADLIGDQYFPSEIRWALRDNGIEFDPDKLKEIGRYLSADNTYSSFSVDGLASAMESHIQFADDKRADFFKYIPDALAHLTDEYERGWIKEIFETLPSYQQVAQVITKDDLFNPQYVDPDDINRIKQFLEIVRLLGPAIKKFQFLLSDLNTKIKAQQDFRVKAYSNPYGHEAGLRPADNTVEILYHATIYANEVAAQGFAVEKPIERLGVGNLGGSQNEISFTHDIKIAMDIVRSLKELTMIANGQLKPRVIADWIRHENIPNFPWHEFMRVNKGYNQYLQPQYEPTTFDRFDIVQTAKLYEKYIWLSKIHPNPVFISIGDLVKTLVGRPINDIGVLECQVDLSKIDFTDSMKRTYLAGESEYRAPREAVLSVKRIM